MPSLPLDTPKDMTFTPNRRNVDLHTENLIKIYNHMEEWKKILFWVSVAAVILFIISIIVCICTCCCRRRRVIKNAQLAKDSSDTMSVVSGPAEFAPSRNMAEPTADGQMVDVSLRTPAPGSRYGYGPFVNGQRNVTGLPQRGGTPADPWQQQQQQNTAERFGGPSNSYMS